MKDDFEPTHPMAAREPSAPHVKNGILFASNGRAHLLRLLDILYLRCGITTPEKLERAYGDTEPQQGA